MTIFLNTDEVNDIEILDDLTNNNFMDLNKEANFKHDFRNMQDLEDSLLFSGFACFMDRNSRSTDMKIVLIGEDSIYKLKHKNSLRKDVTTYFESPFNLDYTGIEVNISKIGMIPGAYQLGLIIKNPSLDNDLLIHTAHTFVKK
jgi:hypothetical protein